MATLAQVVTHLLTVNRAVRWDFPTDHGNVRVTAVELNYGIEVTRVHTRTEGAPLTRRAVVGTYDDAAKMFERWLP